MLNIRMSRTPIEGSPVEKSVTQYGEFAEVTFFLLQQSVMEAEIEARMTGFLDDIPG